VVRTLLNDDTVTVEEAMDFLTEKVNAMEDIIDITLNESTDEEGESFFEYTRRGEATPVIRKSAGNLREGPLDSKKTKSYDSSDDDDEDDDEDDDDDYEEKPRKSSKPKKTPSRNDYDDMDEDDLEADEDDDEDYQPKSKASKDKKPQLQKQNATRQLQNKAMDLDLKMQKHVENISKAVGEVKNAGKAVLRIPGNIVNLMKTGIDEWNRMDEEKRKEKIIQPGYRNEIFKTLKTAIQYGAVWSYKKYMVIVMFICKHTVLHPFYKADEARNKRLRNELTAELETEIAVTEEKIQDASSNGDQKQKYELIRIKKKLEAEKTRVSANSKYI
jgi:hypothetical protein